ncbi:hypothetical protein [uncultured Nocardioides sp.]|uniref:Uncharacterized protein n=1 Tax=uncultured Nocardioides sp. TaxID=198441 RepID=A0A6J4PMY5_9ACTN|nr:hypothetical protein [uncultured Nocardioides sp.]CAA9418659.1 MAG: hypothetical protein AVDCRST_MAG06-3370 [uncultured Nocardioides sp.]
MPLTSPYSGQKPPLPEPVESLRARIPGWGADLDHADRPAYPRESLDLRPAGARWDLPEQQRHDGYRERSIEHADLTPVFGTAQPLRGLSGRIRRLAYERWSEARTAHWLVLIAGDRVDVAAHALRSLATTRPDNPLTQTGVRAEVTHGGVTSRLGTGRTDLKHQWMDPIIVAGPWVAAGWPVYRLTRRALRAAGTLRAARRATATDR